MAFLLPALQIVYPDRVARRTVLLENILIILATIWNYQITFFCVKNKLEKNLNTYYFQYHLHSRLSSWQQSRHKINMGTILFHFPSFPTEHFKNNGKHIKIPFCFLAFFSEEIFLSPYLYMRKQRSIREIHYTLTEH